MAARAVSFRAGMALVVAAGLLSLLSLLAVSLARLAAGAHAGSRSGSEALETRLSAESGLAYAAARLRWEGYPTGSSSAIARGDDWTFRDGLPAPLEGALNPSYAHGEPWTDDGDGRYEPAEPYIDTDGDGRFTARTARLRGPGRGAFSLQIACPEGGLPVNGGYLGGESADTDGDGILNGPGDDRDGDFIPDWRDTDVHPYHRGLAHALNNLGALLLPATCPRVMPSVPTGPGGAGYAFRFSWLGNDLIENRPRGGYRDWDEIAAALTAVGYQSWEIAPFQFFLDVGPYETPPEGGRTVRTDGQDFPPYAPVNYAVAPTEVLQSLWMHLSAAVWIPGGESAALWGYHRRPQAFWSDYRFARLTWGDAEDLHLILYREEAGRLAARAAAIRPGLPFSWKGFYEGLLAERHTIFAEDVADVAAADPTAIVFPERLLRTKMDLAFQAMTADPRPLTSDPYDTWWHFSGYPSWDACGIDSWGDTSDNVQVSGVTFDRIGHVPYPDASGGTFSDWEDAYLEETPCKPQGLTLAPPGRYRVASQARLAAGIASFRATGTLRVRERLDFSSQEDFENLSGGSRLAMRGISVPPEGLAVWEARHDVGTGSDAFPHLVTLPDVNRRMFAGNPSAQQPPYSGFSRTHGALALSWEDVPGGDLAWPLREDFDETLDDPGTDFWHRGTWAPQPSRPLQAPLLSFPWATAAAYRNVEYGASGMAGTGMRVPGFENPGAVAAASTAAWVVPDGSLTFTRTGISGNLTVSLRRGDGLSAGSSVEGLNVDFSCFWPDMSEALVHTSATWFVKEPRARTAGPVHVALDVAREGPHTRFTVYLDGKSDDGAGTALDVVHPALLKCGEEISFWGEHVRDVRFSSALLGPGGADALHAAGGNVDCAVYRSPLYAFDRPARLGYLLTDAFPQVDGTGTVSLRVIGYRDPGGSAVAWDEGPLDAFLPWHRVAREAVRALRYEVTLKRSTVPGGKHDSPIFESLSLGLERPGHAPRWTDWK